MIKNNIITDVNPGDIVGDSPTLPTNAKVVGDELYLRDEEGNIIPGRSTDDGDEITVLDISYGSQLALIQYPTGSGYRQGYVTNATNIIKYNDNYSWVNGSTEEAVYDLDKETQIGTLDPRERAVVLYKVDGMTAVAYDTGKGKLTKSGLVYYEGSGAGGGSTGSGVRPGDIVEGGFTYENNAQVVGDELYLRDENGNIIPGRSVSDGDNITVLDVGYTKQLALVQYPSGDDVRQGYVTNATNLIKYFNQYSWHNGSTEEEVFDENGGHLGSLNPYEAATPLYKKNGMTHVVYDTIKGPNTKSGYAKYEGASPTRVDIPYPSVTNAEKIVYGTSGKGRELVAYRIGNGQNSLVFVCAIHGWEDNWPADGVELTKIGNGLIEHFQNNKPSNWSLYIIPAANPDGISEGFTNNGPGRCTIVGAVDCNRDFPLGFSPGGVPRYHSGSEPLSVSESRSLHDFIQDIKNGTSGEMCVIDLHGWEGAAIGNPEIGQYFRNEFGFEQRYGYGDNRGFMIGWAKSIGAKAALIELLGSTRSHSDVVNGRYLQKIINAVTNLIGGSGGSSTGGDTGSDETYITTGEVIDVQTFLNVRKGPGTNYDSVGKLHQGDEVSIEAKNGDWYKISSPIAGYVNKDFIKITKVVGKTYSEALNIIRGILRDIGFKGNLDVNVPIASIMVGNLKVSAYVGAQFTIGIGEGKVATFSVNNGKIDFKVNGFPMLEFLKIQRKLEEIAVKIEDGNITATINAKGDLTIEIAVKLEKSDELIKETHALYCKITCSTENDDDNRNVYDEAYAFSISGEQLIYASVVLAVVALAFVSPELIPAILMAASKLIPKVAG